MARKFYLLAYPRSGSSIARLLIAVLTHMRPCQASGGVEAPLEHLLKGIDFKGAFYKYHTKDDHPFILNLQKDDVLLYLSRDIFENAVSWAFSFVYRKHKQLPSGIAGLARGLIEQPHKNLTRNIQQIKANEACFNNHTGKKVKIECEKMLASPEYLIEQMRQVIDLDDHAVDEFKARFDELKKKMLDVKSAPTDTIRLNTNGNVTYWKDLLGKEMVDKFNKLL